MLTGDERVRYARQLALPEVGVRGQERLRDARVAIVGAGGLGSPVALFLAAAGVGTLGIIDDDRVETSNLHRQVIHRHDDIGRDKTVSAANAITSLNPHVRVRRHQERLDSSRAAQILGDYELVVDGADNFPTRYAINDACAALGIPWIYGSVERFSGQVSVFGMRDGPCYRCVFSEPPSPGSSPSCEEIGVLGAVPGVVGTIQATEAIKVILGVGDPLAGRLLQIDFLRATTHIIDLERRPDCETCRPRSAAARGSEDSSARAEIVSASAEIEPAELAGVLGGANTVRLIDIREPWEWSLARIGDPMMVPISQLEEQLEMLDQTRELVLYCHHGVRSGVAVEWLRTRGIRARHLVGGIDRWSREIDPTVPRY